MDLFLWFVFLFVNFISLHFLNFTNTTSFFNISYFVDVKRFLFQLFNIATVSFVNFSFCFVDFYILLFPRLSFVSFIDFTAFSLFVFYIYFVEFMCPKSTVYSVFSFELYIYLSSIRRLLHISRRLYLFIFRRLSMNLSIHFVDLTYVPLPSCCRESGAPLLTYGNVC